MHRTGPLVSGVVAATLLWGASATAADRMPPYRGRALDRIPAGKIQHVVFEQTHRTTKDGQPVPEQENELDFTQRFESWNSRTRGRIVTTLAAGRFVSDDSRRAVAVGEVIEETSLVGNTCRRWRPDINVIYRWRCTGVNDRGTAVLEHSETGLAHHFRHRRHSRYDIAVVTSAGRRVVRLRTVFEGPGRGTGRETVGDVPEGAPQPGRRRTVRTAKLSRTGLRLISDKTRSRYERDGHVYVRVTTIRVVRRRLLPDTAANRALMRMTHPGATVKRRRATHDEPE